ncbi:sulfurtransferase [Nocardioides sp. Soil777]|uniref:rhodanese-like domain-containing protein n=1 Tax=Nocardioides sp. Soil777 TaxID=1736409 RepID=UPI000702DEBE|nr:rhodanese-like domain-containing protein [Nocardioides sp. Soil777]KRE99287.1 sulfurtransferase [Nocardioides sp. Soil777]
MTKSAMQMLEEARAEVGAVAPVEAAAQVTAGEAVLLDVREGEEWQHGHIDGSVPAPRGLLEFLADPTSPRHKTGLDPARRVIVVCASGTRATFAAATLKTLGYVDPVVLEGGITAWAAAGLPVNEHEYTGI